MRPIVHGERLVHHCGVAAEAPDPVFITEHQHGGRAGLFVFRTEGAAKERLHAEHVKVVPGNDSGFHPFRFASAEQDEIHVVILDQAVEGMALRPVVADLRHREGLIQ